MTTDLDVLESYSDRDDLTPDELVIGLSLLSIIADRLPDLSPRQRRHVAEVAVGYALHVADLLPPKRAVIYRQAARSIAARLTEVEYIQ